MFEAHGNCWDVASLRLGGGDGKGRYVKVLPHQFYAYLHAFKSAHLRKLSSPKYSKLVQFIIVENFRLGIAKKPLKADKSLL